MRSTLLDRVRAGLSDLSAEDPTSWSDAEVSAALPVLLTAWNQLSAVVASVVGTFDARDLAQVDGLRATRTWLTGFGRMSQGSATTWLHRAHVLRQLPVLAGKASTGVVPVDCLRPVCDLVERVGAVAVAAFDAILASLAADATPAQVGTACARIGALVDPDGPDPDPKATLERRQLTVARSGSMVAVRGQLDQAGGAALLAALDALMRPPGPDEQSTPAQRRADAVVELATRALTHGDLPTVQGERPHLGILITPTALIGAHPDTDEGKAAGNGRSGCATVGATDSLDRLTEMGVPELPERAWLSWIGDVPAQIAQRLACDATVWRTVLDPATGLPLDVGRTQRIVPHWIRKALHARDRGCRWPGCSTPAAWTDAHHAVPWYLGGETNIDNLLSLCRWHHTLVHEGQWHARLDPTTGELHVTRPDGRPYELGPSKPWLTPTSQRGDPAPGDTGPPGRAAA